MADEQMFSMAGTRVYISDGPVEKNANVTPADFEDVTWVEISGLFSVGELGGEQTINEYELINSDWVMKTKGTRNGGTMTNVFVPMHDDPGQTLFRDAIEDNCSVYAFRVDRGADCAEEDEEGNPIPIAGMTDYFQGFATDGPRAGGERSANYTRTYPVSVNGRIVTV